MKGALRRMVETFIWGIKYYGINEEKRLRKVIKGCLKLREVEESTGGGNEENQREGKF